VQESYITPYYSSSIQSGLATDQEDFRNSVSSAQNLPDYREVVHDLGVRFKPAVAMPDLPVAVWLWTSYGMNYDRFGSIQKSVGTQSYANDPLWIYFDVLPGTLDEFLNWTVLSSNDFDGDGLPNAEEAQYVKIVNKKSGLALAVEGGSQAEGAQIRQYPFADQDHYKWKVEVQPGRTRIYAKHSGKVLTSTDTYAVQYTWDMVSSQHWNLQPVEDGYFKIVDNYGGALAVEGGSLAAGAHAATNPYADADQFKWKLEPVSSKSYYKITAKHSGKALEVSGGSRDEGANVDQWSYSGANNQKWRLEPVGDGTYRVINKNSGKALGVAGHCSPTAPMWRFIPRSTARR
jgi:hypothetical protein